MGFKPAQTSVEPRCYCITFALIRIGIGLLNNIGVLRLLPNSPIRLVSALEEGA
jgi:hypothetical protein